MKEKLGFKNYFGYTMCDFANNLAFGVMGSYLSVYCSDILGISGLTITAILIAARIWDAINDPIMGFLVQNKKPGKYGKYRPFIIYGGYPLALVAVLVFTRVSDNLLVSTIWVAAMYILYGMIYTVLLVPYGSLASVMTTDDGERSILSICRAIGGGFGNLPSFIFPVCVMVAGADHNQMDAGRLLIGMIVIAIAMVVLYTIAFLNTKEQVVAEAIPEKVNILSTIKGLLANKAFVIMSLLGCLVIAVQMYLSTVNLYLFKDYFNNSSLNTIYMAVSYLPMIIMMPFTGKILKRIGKKEFCVASLAVSAVASFLSYVLHIGSENATLFLVLAFFINAGIGFIVLEVWAMAADVIDHQEWISGKREEAADYAIFTFMRKIGQALAALAPWFVGLAGYDSSLAGSGVSQGQAVLDRMYGVATLVPFIAITLMLVLAIFYPLNKATMDRMHAELRERRGI